MSASTFDLNVARGVMLGDGFRKNVVKITGPTSYVTGGEAITAGQFRGGAIEYWPPTLMPAISGAATAVMAQYNYLTGKLQYFYPGGAGGTGGTVFPFTPADMKGATTVVAGSSTADQAAANVNANFIATAATFTASAGTLIVAKSPDIGRSITITVLNDSGGALDLYEGTTTYTVTGTFRGVAQVELITFVSTLGNKSVANSKFRFKQGILPFDTVTSITYDNAAAGGLKVEAGLGSLIGLPVNRLTPADADVLVFSISGVPTTVAGAFSDTNKTVQVGTTADAWDLQLMYLVAAAAGNTFAEVANGTDLSGFSGRVLTHCK
jgi:hypothetical protein